MIGVIATLRIKSDKGAEFEAVFAELTSQVRATESGNVGVVRPMRTNLRFAQISL